MLFMGRDFSLIYYGKQMLNINLVTYFILAEKIWVLNTLIRLNSINVQDIFCMSSSVVAICWWLVIKIQKDLVQCVYKALAAPGPYKPV